MAGENRIQAVIFDMDGVLTDSEPLINSAAVARFKEQGLKVKPEDFSPFVGTGEDRYIGGVAEKYGLPLDVASAKKRTYEIYLGLVPSRLRAFTGAVELVRACKSAGLKAAVASSADRIKIDANLREIGLPPETWDVIVGAEDVAQRKPAPDIFLTAARKLGLTPRQCVVVEDAVNGVHAAKAAGMRCIAVEQTFPREKLECADLVKERISEVTVADLTGESKSVAQSGPPALPVGSMHGDGRESRAESRPWGLWATLGFGLVIAGAFLGAQIAFTIFFTIVVMMAGRGELLADAKKLAANGLFLALATCVAAPVGIGTTCLFAWLRKRLSVSEYLRLKSVPARELFRWYVALLLLGAFWDGLSSILGRPIVPDVIVEAYQTAGFPPLLWFALMVLAPLNEEIFFRGFLFAGISHSRLGGRGAILLTSVLWAVIHVQYDFYGVANIFTAGLLLGYARLKTNSILPTILMHALMNLVATIQVVALIWFEGGS